MKVLAFLAVLAMLVSGCGYRVAGQADLLPDSVRTIAVPAFENATTRVKLTQMLPQAITREFLSRTRYRVVGEPGEADATLHGTVVNYYSSPTIFDSSTARAAAVQVTVILDVRLVDNATGAVLYQSTGMNVQNRYEISSDQTAYFDESDTALARVSGDVARTVVSGVLEKF